MSNVIFHDFKKQTSASSPLSAHENSFSNPSVWIGKNGTKFFTVKFDAIFENKKNLKNNDIKKERNSSVELIKEIIERINFRQ